MYDGCVCASAFVLRLWWFRYEKAKADKEQMKKDELSAQFGGDDFEDDFID